MIWRYLLIYVTVVATMSVCNLASAQDAGLNAILKRYNEAYTAGDYTTALVEAQRLEAAVKAQFGANHQNYAIALNALALAAQGQGKSSDAEGLFKRVLAIREKVLGEAHADFLETLKNLARAYEDSNKFGDAEASYRRLLSIKEKSLGKGHFEVGVTLNSLGVVAAARGKHSEAEESYRRALAIVEKSLGADHLSLALVLDNLAASYSALGKHGDAEKVYARSYAIREKALGPKHPDLQKTMQGLARAYEAQSKHADAEVVYRGLLAIREAAVGADHAAVGAILNDLALSLHAQKKFAEAEALYNRALGILTKMLGEDHQGVAAVVDNLGDMFRAQKKFSNAEVYYKRALSIRERVLGENHPEFLRSLRSSALNQEQSHKFSEAEKLYRRLLAITEKTAGPAHQDAGDALNSLGIVLVEQGDHVSAEAAFRRALAILEKALGATDVKVAQVLNNLAATQYAQNKLNEAEGLHRRAVAIREKALRPSDPVLAESLNNLANVYRAQKRYADAEFLYKRASDILEKAFGQNDPNVMLSLKNLAAVYALQENNAEAVRLYQKLLIIEERELGESHPNLAQPLLALADLLNSVGRYGEAEIAMKRALSIGKAASGSRDTTGELNTLARIYAGQGKYVDAEAAAMQALRILESEKRQDSADAVYALNVLALVFKEQGKFGESERLHKRALDIFERGVNKDEAALSHTLNNLGALYTRLDRPEEATALLRRALSIKEKALGPAHVDVATTLINLATILSDQEKYADAESLQIRALHIREKALGHQHPLVAHSLHNVALAYKDQSKFVDAEVMYRRALKIKEERLGPDHHDVALTVSNLGQMYELQGKFSEAEALLKRAVQIQQAVLGASHPDSVKDLNSLTSVYLSQKKYAEALRSTQQVIETGYARPSTALPALYNAQRVGLQAARPSVDAALKVVQRASQSSVAGAVEKLAVRLSAKDDKLARVVRHDQDLAAEIALLDKNLIAAVSLEPKQRNRSDEQRVKVRLEAATKERNALQQVLASEFPDYAAISNPLPLSISDLQGQLSSDEALVVFGLASEQESYVFAITRDEVSWHPISLGGAALTKTVAAFRTGLDFGDIQQKMNDISVVNKNIDLTQMYQLHGSMFFDLHVAHNLYNILFGPIEVLIRSKKNLLVVPSGALTAIPFHLLVTERPAAARPENISGYRDAAWVLKRQAVTVLPSVASLKAIRSQSRIAPATKPLIGFADPVFNPATASSAASRRANASARTMVVRSFADFWKGAEVDASVIAERMLPLPDTADELKAVAKTLGVSDADIHLGREATERRVKATNLSDYRILYFATHGLVAGDIKGLAEPSLALSLPAQPSEFDDGLLTSSEVTQLKLNADWVVLSACNTIAGDKPGAEALSGLARSFFYAGARALLVTHWAVNSAAATELTTKTFQKIEANRDISRSEAMRQAMLDYMKDPSEPSNAYPGYWGAFVVVGDGRAIYSARGESSQLPSFASPVVGSAGAAISQPSAAPSRSVPSPEVASTIGRFELFDGSRILGTKLSSAALKTPYLKGPKSAMEECSALCTSDSNCVAFEIDHSRDLCSTYSTVSRTQRDTKWVHGIWR